MSAANKMTEGKETDKKGAAAAESGEKSKGQMKKEAKKAEKAAKRAADKEQKGGQQQAETDGPDISQGKYGVQVNNFHPFII